MKRSTLGVLVGVLVVLAGVAVLITRSRQPTKSAETAISNVVPGDFTEIGLTVNGATITLKSVEGVWRVVAPFDDRANVERVDDMITTLRDTRLGSTLSENPAKFSQYDIADASATRLQVYIRDHTSPVMDLWVGKEAPNRLGSYVRAPGSNEVRIAEGLQNDVFIKNPEVLRSPRVYADEANEATGITATGAVDVTVEKSTSAWVNAKNKRMVPPDVSQQLTDGLQSWRSTLFATTSSVPGFDKPYLVLTVTARKRPFTITVGGAAAEMPESRYIRTSDRSAVLVVPDSSTDAVVAALKKIQAL
jgi:hypothetical protein